MRPFLEATAKRAQATVGILGLPWDDACLRPQDNRRVVRTASQWQVRQPIYHSSVGRWRPYREQLRPLLDALGFDPKGDPATAATVSRVPAEASV